MKKTLLLATLSLFSSAYAYEAQLKKGELTPSLEALLQKASVDTGVNFDASNFTLIEERELATSNFSMYVQTTSMIPVAETAIRIWSDKKTKQMILAEMHLSEAHKEQEAFLSNKFRKAKFSVGALKSNKLTQAIQKAVISRVGNHETAGRIISMKFQDQWVKGDLVRQVEVRSRRGIHHLSFSLFQNKIIRESYSDFPQADYVNLKANVFPIYEEVETTHEMLPYEVREIKYLDASIRDGGKNPLGNIPLNVYSETKYSPLVAETAIGQQFGIWSEASIRREIDALVGTYPLLPNDMAAGLLLQGKYATINLHPGVQEAFGDIDFSLKPSVNHIIGWSIVDDHYEAKPVSGFYGKKIHDEDDLINRIPLRLPDNNPAKYINSGVDEVQVYFAITTLMEALAEMGFSDKDLSTKPFHAFLFDPDISMKDNAYYTDNTINFTTYSPEMINLARDNSTIWHELGHGVMDRLMGSFLTFGDTKAGYGGLSEGMADFLAKLVLEHQTEGRDFPGKNAFRIMNSTGFYLTNEFHDEGEAYGGVMSDMLDIVIATSGREGLFAFTDLTLETMRLTRNHPALLARSWFEHMVYADELGSDVRVPGRFTAIINQALAARNFAFADTFNAAQMTVTHEGKELTSTSPASREKPLTACSPSGLVDYKIQVSLTEGDSNFIKFPAIVKVEYKTGALQGAIKWTGEESNPTVYVVNGPNEILDIPLQVSMKCDQVNQPDGSCKDYAYVQVWNQGATKPLAKKRFYLKVKDQATTCE